MPLFQTNTTFSLCSAKGYLHSSRALSHGLHFILATSLGVPARRSQTVKHLFLSNIQIVSKTYQSDVNSSGYPLNLVCLTSANLTQSVSTYRARYITQYKNLYRHTVVHTHELLHAYFHKCFWTLPETYQLNLSGSNLFYRSDVDSTQYNYSNLRWTYLFYLCW